MPLLIVKSKWKFQLQVVGLGFMPAPSTDCLRWSTERSILVERNVRVYAIVICLIIGEQMANMPLPQRHDMVKALASDRSDQPFNMTVATANVVPMVELERVSYFL